MNKWEAVGGKLIFNKEPDRPKCPKCEHEMEAEFVDNGFGPYSIQASPYHCFECGYTEGDES